MSKEDPVAVLETVLNQMTPDNWEAYGWGHVSARDPNAPIEGTACLLHQLEIAGGLPEGTHEDGVKETLRRTTRLLMAAIRRRYNSVKGHPTRSIEEFNDSPMTSYEDARIVVEDALARAKAEASRGT